MDKEVIAYQENDKINIVYVIDNQSINKFATNFPNCSILPQSSIPTNRIYRDAWTFNNTKTAVIVDIPKARDIHRAVLRIQRAPRLTALDVGYMRALERGDTIAAQEIAAQKQTLRDIPAHPAIEAAQTPEELMALTLDALLAL